MVDFRALADNLKRALRDAAARFTKKRTAAPTFEVIVHDIEYVSVEPFRMRETVRRAEAVYIVDGQDDFLFLPGESKIAMRREGEEKTYFSLQADGVVERLADFLDGDIDKALVLLKKPHKAMKKLFT